MRSATPRRFARISGAWPQVKLRPTPKRKHIRRHFFRFPDFKHDLSSEGSHLAVIPHYRRLMPGTSDAGRTSPTGVMFCFVDLVWRTETIWLVMPLSQNPYFDPDEPSEDAAIWRYLSMPKFQDLMANDEL